MEANHTMAYDIDKSVERIDDILNASNDNFSDKDSILKRSELTYTNGFYVYVTALFIDLVGSSDMTDEHKRPTLAKIYRSFISESVAIINSSEQSKEISINGDCVWAVFETPLKSDIQEVFTIAAKLNSLVKLLNYKYGKKGYSKISAGIGMDYGRVLMIKAGYSGSSLNDVIWMGDAINQACHLANKANRNSRKKVLLSGAIHTNLTEKQQGLCEKYYDSDEGKYLYEASVINKNMDKWYKENCK